MVNQPRPMGLINAADIADRVARRHRHDDAGLADPPGADDLLGLIRFMRDRHPHLTVLDGQGRPVPDVAAQHIELHEALMLTRLAHMEVKRLQLSLLKAARRAGMTAKQRGQPLGLGSRQGILDREEALERELDAASKHVPVDALDDQPAPVELGPAAVRQLAQDLVTHWDELLTDDGEGEDSWMADLALKLRDLNRLGIVDLTGTDLSAIVALVRQVVEEINEQSAATGQPGAATASAQAVLERARRLDHRHTRPGARSAAAE